MPQRKKTLPMSNLVLGVCGGIAAYKSAFLASGFSRKGFAVRTIMTSSAGKFITPLTFETLTGEIVYTDLFDKNRLENHTALARWADLAVVAPATATTMARMAAGFADELLSAFLLDFSGPVFLCPSMHGNMLKKPPVKHNISHLKERGYRFIGPVEGRLAGGDSGPGRMEEPERIIKEVESFLGRGSAESG